MKTKAAKAAEFALKLKSENDAQSETMSSTSPKKNVELTSTIGGMSTVDSEKKIKEMEKRITKMRNEK